MGLLQRNKPAKCTIPDHGNALPCPKCKREAAKAAAGGTGPRPCPKCGKTMRGGVCPGAFC
jgi:ribosomal protein L37AE/L43A